VTPIAAQMLDPHATSEIGDGTYCNFAVVSLPDAKTDSHGDDEPLKPPTTQRSSDVHASP
jgi:hypothetical protein